MMMGPSLIWALAPLIALTVAFKDTSPFFLLSTSELLTPSQPNLVSASTLSEAIIPQLETCPSDTYVVISQPGVRATDFADRRATPFLRQMVKGDDKLIRSSTAVTDVSGSLDINALVNVVKVKCGAGFSRVDASTGNFHIADDTRPRVIHLDLPALPTPQNERLSKLAENDAFLSSLLDFLPSPSYTILYTTTPPNQSSQGQGGSTWQPNKCSPAEFSFDADPYHPQQQPISPAPAHMDLKRKRSPSSSSTNKKTIKPRREDHPPAGPLFERYSFLSPGLFMGLLVSFILLSILYVGISAIAGLEVSYAAFDKEMGPAGGQGKKG